MGRGRRGSLPASLGIHPYLLLGFGKPQGFAFPARVPWEKHPLLRKAHRQDMVAPIPSAPPLLQSRGKSEIGSQNVPPLFPAPAPHAGVMGTVWGPVGCHQRGNHPQSCQESDGQKLKGTAQDSSITHSGVREPGPTAGHAVGQGPPPAPLWQRGAAGSASQPARYAAAARRMETSGSGPQTSGAPS